MKVNITEADMRKNKLRGKRAFEALGQSARANDNKNSSRKIFWWLHPVISKQPKWARMAFTSGYCGNSGIKKAVDL